MSDIGSSKSGDWPIRWRGYYRALKRKEEWAIYLSKKPIMERLFTWTYARPSAVRFVEEFLSGPNPFLELIKKDGRDYFQSMSVNFLLEDYENKK